MELINSICLDIAYYEDKLTIIRKYLLPKILEEKSLKNVNPLLIQDVFHSLNPEQIEILRPEIQEIVGDFETEDFVETKWKIGTCKNCEQLKAVLKCKGLHDEECEYGEVTTEEGCGSIFCDACIYHLCAHTNDCKAVRCESCCH